MLVSLWPVERALVLKFIELTSMHNSESISEPRFLDIGREVGMAAALRGSALQKLCNLEIFNRQQDEYGLEQIIRIHPNFYEEALLLYHGEGTDLSSDPVVPAADRFVSLDHNNPIVVDARQAVTELSETIKKANKLVANPDDQVGLSKEVDYIKGLISQPRLHVVALWYATKNNTTLRWLMEQTISGVVRDVAMKAFGHLVRLLSNLS